uniref:plant cystathionine gamma-synthase n=1 Tax=Alexandrium andersonii TaxID=327968 RepID=A0A7S2F0D0_9DINO
MLRAVKVAQTAARPGLAAARRFAAAKSGTWMEGPLALETDLVHAAVSPEVKSGAILTPLFLSTTFVQDSVEDYLKKGYSYSRTNNPTVTALESKLAVLENGAGACAFGTGMAATTSAISATMKAGDHCIITDCSYGGTNRSCREFFTPLGMEFTFTDFRDVDNIRKAVKPNTKLIFSETPANPLLSLCDIEAISKIAKEAGAKHVVDATFATPVICRPLDHGADMVIQSLTKYYEGHNILTGGAVISKDKELADKVKWVQNVHGNIMNPFAAFIVLQTTKTMALRVKQQSATALAIAQFLETHPKVTKVVYPGLASHPQKALADKYHRNNLHGGMLWFDIVGGSEAGTKLMNNVQRPWSLCENLGATESIITACAVMTHANMLKEDRLKVGITDGFIRISCGIEDTADLIKALKEGLDSI